MSGQRSRFSELFWRLIDAVLNTLFDLRPRAATLRLVTIIFLFFFSGFVISLFYYPLSDWLWRIQDIFGYLFDPNYSPIYPGDPFYNLASYAFTVFTDPRVLQYLPIFLAPFFIALQTAANYLADVFELQDPRVARKFVQAVALTGSNQTIRISQGNVIEDDKSSPVFLIGGPGRVLVDMDSAALFESPDGTPRVIPSTRNQSSRRVSLDGFERFRQAVDLRPHVIELRDEGGSSAEIQGRSLDGIPISATDVCFQFTVFRNGMLPTAGTPHPFFADATIEGLVYQARSIVKPELTNPSKFEPNWPGNMVGLVRGRLGGFMNDHKLTEYLASFGQPEVNKFNENGLLAANAARDLTNPEETDRPAARRASKPPFYPRDQLKLLLFNLYAAQFNREQWERGVELYWLGMGTWRVPVEIFPETGIVPEQHMEAWKLSRENLKKEGGIAGGKYRNEATAQKFKTLIQEVPAAKPLSAITDNDRRDAMKALLNAYRLQLIQAAEFMKAKKRKVPEIIVQAVDCLNGVLGESWQPPEDVDPKNECPPSDGFESLGPERPVSPGHGSPSSGQPSPFGDEPDRERSEQAWFTELVLLLGGDEAQADRLTEHERKNFPKESRRELIQRAIERLLRDRR